MKLTSYLIFPGTCAEAFALYTRVLGAQIVTNMRYDQMPPGTPIPPNSDGKIAHVCIATGDFRLMGGDMVSTAECETAKMPGAGAVHIAVGSVEEAQRIFAALGEGGTVTMPLAPTFWSKQFGMVRDRFGADWMLDCEMSPSEMAAAQGR